MTTIITKNGSGAPLASDLVQGELAVDLTNKRLYTEDSGGSVIEIGTTPTSIAATGNVTGANLNIANWDTAYGWGDHSTEGYLTSYTETSTLADVTGRGATTSTALTLSGAVSFGAEIVETVYSLSGTSVALDPANGTIQTQTLTANTTYTDSLASGESITLLVDDGAGYTITWPTITWEIGAAPTLPSSGYLRVVVYKVGSVLYGAY